MRLLTILRRMDDQKKSRFVFITTFVITLCIVVVGFWYTKSFSNEELQKEKDQEVADTTSSFFTNAKETITPIVSDIKERIHIISEGYKGSTFKDFFVPKNE